MSQESSGSGTTADPYRIVTVVTGGQLRVTQTDTYVVGSEAYGTRVAIANESSTTAESIVLYRAGDCYLQNSDVGYGRVDTAGSAVACTTGTTADSRIEQWAPETAGAHYYESNYSSVWTAVGSQQPFPDTCDCSVDQDNGAGLSWSSTIAPDATAAFAHLTSFSPNGSTQVVDSDGDGFPDAWERADGGIDTNGNSVVDLKLSDYGATPDKPDVFVQVGETKSTSCHLIFFCSTTNRHPSLAALRDVQEAYAAHGIRLHIDAGPNSVMNPDTGAKWGNLSQATQVLTIPATIPGATSNGEFDWTQSFDGYANQLLSAQRRSIFHLALYVGRFNTDGNTGLSRSGNGGGLAGNDFMLAYDVFNGRRPTRIEEAGTFMHELGHQLGLSHGGSLADATINFKPDYPSVMNYLWQLNGVDKNDSLGLLDYSEGTLDTVDETDTNEARGLEPDSAAGNIATRWICPGTSDPQLRAHDPVPSIRNVDWNCDNSISSTSTPLDLNGNGGNSLLADHDDWHSLIFDGGGTLGGAGDPESSAPTSPPDSEPTAALLLSVAVPLSNVTLASPGELQMQQGTAAPTTVTITNHHPDSATYTLSLTQSGVTVSGLPATVTLAGGETRSLPVTLTAGSTTEPAFFEVDAASTSQATDTGTTVTDVDLEDAPVTGQPPVVGAPAAVLPVSGDAQAAAVGQTFDQPLVASVQDAAGNPVPGVPVVFTISSGATFTHDGGTTYTATTDATGGATSDTMKAGSTPGAFSVTASADEATPATFAETVTDTTKSRADLQVKVSAPAKVSDGQVVAATVTVTNAGPNTASKLLAVIQIPASATVKDSGGLTFRHGIAVIRIPQLASRRTTSYTVRLVLPKSRVRTFDVRAAVIAATRDPVLRNNWADARVRVS